jgi:hypothetical protein
VVAVALAAVPAGGASSPKPYVKNVTGWVTALAMDGSQVAFATKAYAPTNCFKAFTWSVATHAGVLVSGPKKGSCHSEEPSGETISAIALAGKRVAWIRSLAGNTEADDYLYTATLGQREVKLESATRTGDTSGSSMKGRWIGGLVGSGKLLTANIWATDGSGTVTYATLEGVTPGKLHQLAAGPGTLTAESSDSDRVAVARSDGTVAIYGGGGSLLETITPSSVKEIALRKDYLVALTKTRTLEIYNANTGAFIRKWPVPAGTAHLDVNQNIAVFSVWRRVYAVQLTTGKQAVIAGAKRAIVAAQIEAPGVVYAYNTVKGLKDIGNIAFLPLAGVTSALA